MNPIREVVRQAGWFLDDSHIDDEDLPSDSHVRRQALKFIIAIVAIIILGLEYSTS